MLRDLPHARVLTHTGSVSAEHGLGLMKAEAIHYTKSPQAVAIMAALKRAFDPNLILNPYKLLPAAALEEAARFPMPQVVGVGT